MIKQEIDAGFSEPSETENPPPIKLPKVTLTGTPQTTTATTTQTVNGKLIRKQVVLAFNPSFKLGANIKRCQIATAKTSEPIAIHQSNLSGVHNSQNRLPTVARRVERSVATNERLSPVIATAQVNLDKLQARNQNNQSNNSNNSQVKQEPENAGLLQSAHNNQNQANNNFNKYQSLENNQSLENGICARTHGLTGFRFDGSDVGTPENASSPSTSSER